MAKFKSIKNQFKKVKEQLEEEKNKTNNGGSNVPNWEFKPQMVKDEEETVFKIRFLPVPESKTGKPWFEVRYHMFEREGDNRYIKALDPRSFDKNAKNPITELVNKLYASGNPVDEEQAANMRSKARYMTLVYVKEAPENQKHFEGKVFVYEAGVQVHRKMLAAIDKYDMCFWDPFEGTDFLLSMKETGTAKRKYPSYLESDFVRRDSPITEDEEEMDKIAEQIEELKIKDLLIKKDGIKTAEELQEMLEGGLTGDEKRVSNKPSAKDLTSDSDEEIGDIDEISDDDIGDIDDDPDFGDKEEAKEEETPKKPKVEESSEVEADIDDLDVDFSDEDFNID